MLNLAWFIIKIKKILFALPFQNQNIISVNIYAMYYEIANNKIYIYHADKAIKTDH